MAVQTDPRSEPRRPWNRAQLLRAAIDLADKGGIESLSMRKLSQELGGGTMSLYNHFSNKDDLLYGMIDSVFSEIELPAGEHDWNACGCSADPRRRANACGCCAASNVRGCARPPRCGVCTSCCASRAPTPTTLPSCARPCACSGASNAAAICGRTATSCMPAESPAPRSGFRSSIQPRAGSRLAGLHTARHRGTKRSRLAQV